LGGTDPDLGVNIALKGLRVDPLSLPLNYQLSVFFDARHEFDEAFRYARRLIEIAPDSPRGHERLAELEGTVNGRMDKMILGMTHAARLDVRHAWFLVSAGSAYANLGDYDMALRYYEKAASLVEHSSRETARFALHRAVALLHLGRREKAVAVLKQVVESEGRGLGNLAVAMLADLSLQEGRARDALSYWKSLFPECFDGGSISSSCRHIEWRLRIARVLQELGQPEEMQRLEPELLANLEADRAEVDAAAWRLGFYSPGGIFDVRVLAALGRREQALAALEQAVDQGWRGWAGPHWPGEWKYDMQLDSLMDAIRDDARFKAAFARIEADRSEQLEIVREMERRGEIPSRDELPEPKFEE
jgi:tetratricopeptide (TPR) repeat protein